MRDAWTVEGLVEGVKAGDRRALARAISVVEDGDVRAAGLVRALYRETGRAHVVGVTGPPGAGKSSLVSALVRRVRTLGSTVGVLCVDPSSPFTEGALLGDRIRLADHYLDPGVFIRSMSARGHPGGLAETTLQAALVLDAAGKDVLFLETVGAGQSEVEVEAVADTVLLVLMPGSGDAIQALKAGIMEIPDVVAVNKRDLPHADAAAAAIRQVLSLAASDRRPPVLLTDALTGQGVDELWDALAAHRRRLAESGELGERRARNLTREVFAIASARARTRLERAAREDPELARLLEAVARRELDPLSAVQAMVESVFRLSDGDEDGTGSR